MSKKKNEITDYDTKDTSEMVNPDNNLTLEDLGLELPENPPTQVVSIRLPTDLLNQLRALESQDDVPYQALIKLILSEGVKKRSKKKSA